MFLMAISGIPIGYISSKVDNIYMYTAMIFACAFAFSAKEFFQDLFALYGYWIILPIITHLVLMELTIKFIEKRNKK